ncbi:hypothetical protein FHG87_022745 [Trinorchestia longiramus]|nr:hypothetical protein FHG87_022745 [Trinorchestia longiramus]
MNDGIRRFGVDPIAALKNINFKTVGLVGAGILLAVLLIDLLGYLYAAYKGSSKQYVPYSRSLAIMAADAWDNRSSNAIGEFYDPYARARSVEPLTAVLDSLASAARRWGDDSTPESSPLLPPPSFQQNLSQNIHNRQRLDKPFIFSQ